jgi:hypothetical protein
MDAVEELYYLLGRLESLQMKNEVRVDELNFARNILEKNKFFKETEDEFDLEDENEEYYSDYDDSEPIIMGDPRYDRSENPWIDVFGEGEEAEAAYWNTE